jgi:phosphatidylserine/phosphatidylglycerophosphate/cardiolipin synthase-like enzyme
MSAAKTKQLTDAITLKFLTGAVFDKGNEQAIFTAAKPQAKAVAELLAAHIESARQSLSMAIYDFRLANPEGGIVIDALNVRAEAGVNVRLAYFQQPPKRSAAAFAALGSDPAPGTDQDFLKQLHPKVKQKAVTEEDIKNIAASVKKKPIAGGGHLMHSKYVICDAPSPAASVWTGSANFTTDAWTVQDNNIVVVQSQQLSSLYATDFEELWDAGRITGTGKDDLGTASVNGIEVDAAFAPGEGASIDTAIAGHISAARERIAIASMVISSGAILGALVDALDRGVELTGIYDGPEMTDVEKDWAKGTKGGTGQGKASQWETVKQRLVAKRSQPYTDTGLHNFMHNKCVAIDGQLVVTGSFNFSQNATRNAENVLTFHDEGIAGQFAQYIQSLVAKYR